MQGVVFEVFRDERAECVFCGETRGDRMCILRWRWAHQNWRALSSGFRVIVGFSGLIGFRGSRGFIGFIGHSKILEANRFGSCFEARC